jgi:hypothetical protein
MRQSSAFGAQSDYHGSYGGSIRLTEPTDFDAAYFRGPKHIPVVGIKPENFISDDTLGMADRQPRPGRKLSVSTSFNSEPCFIVEDLLKQARYTYKCGEVVIGIG